MGPRSSARADLPRRSCVRLQVRDPSREHRRCCVVEVRVRRRDRELGRGFVATGRRLDRRLGRGDAHAVRPLAMADACTRNSGTPALLATARRSDRVGHGGSAGVVSARVVTCARVVARAPHVGGAGQRRHPGDGHRVRAGVGNLGGNRGDSRAGHAENLRDALDAALSNLGAKKGQVFRADGRWCVRHRPDLRAAATPRYPPRSDSTRRVFGPAARSSASLDRLERAPLDLEGADRRVGQRRRGRVFLAESDR